jgi:3-hydroxyisobutyrate dehydrogenase
MGANLARRLHDVGFPIVALYGARPEAAAEVAAETGGEVSASLAPQGDSLLTKRRDALSELRNRHPQIHRDVERMVTERGGDSLEACMASSIPQARNGALPDDRRPAGGLERVKPLLQKMSASLKYVGEASTAAQVKALVNMVMNVNTAGPAEGLGLGDALGLDLDVLREVFSQTGANSRVLETDGGADMQHREHDVYFSAGHAAKDCGIALSLAREARLTLSARHRRFRAVRAHERCGFGRVDKSGVSELTFKSRRGRATVTGQLTAEEMP